MGKMTGACKLVAPLGTITVLLKTDLLRKFGHNLGTNETGFRILIDTRATYLVRRGGLEPPRDCSR